jgi:hypothetical protein
VCLIADVGHVSAWLHLVEEGCFGDLSLFAYEDLYSKYQQGSMDQGSHFDLKMETHKEFRNVGSTRYRHLQ